MTVSPVCPQCGRAHVADPALHGLCPACLLAAAALTGDDDRECPYQVLAPIEEDARGVTYLAQWTKAPVPVFVELKVVLAADGPAILSRFHQSQPALAHLHHPGAAKVIDAGLTTDGSVYIASQYVAGSPLSEMLSRPSLARGARVEIGRQLTQAVSAAHAAGVVHLQLDASKVKVSTAGGLHASIAGFGLGVIAEGRVGGPDIARLALEHLIRRLDL